MIKTVRSDYKDANPIFTDVDFVQNDPPILFSDDDRLNSISISTENRKAYFSDNDLLEAITGTVNYKLGNNHHDVEFKLHFDGSVELTQTYGPEGETPTRRVFPRACPTVDELQDELVDNDATFMRRWLEDMFNVLRRTPRLKGNIKLGNLEAIEYDPNCDPSQTAAKLILKAKNFGNATSFEAHFTRSDAVRSDFTDKISIKVSQSRRVRAEYCTNENSSFAHGPMAAHTIGSIREDTDLALLSKVFPNGFTEREPEDFLIRFINFNTGVIENHPWPNRQTCNVASGDDATKVTGLVSGVRRPFKH
jgi:hypothetical protein